MAEAQEEKPSADITLALIRKARAHTGLHYPACLVARTLVVDTVYVWMQKAEHHDGCLFDLEELSMPHQRLRAIALVGRICPALRILSLQANRITRLENLHRLKVSGIAAKAAMLVHSTPTDRS